MRSLCAGRLAQALVCNVRLLVLRCVLPEAPSSALPSAWSLQGLEPLLSINASSSPPTPSTYSSKLCGFCGNYDGDGSNDHQKPDGSPALDDEELGNSWQTAEDEDKE